MCLVLMGWRTHPIYAVVVAANRDELYRFAAAPLAWRTMCGAPLLAGLDVPSGGTWMGVNTAGRFGVVTNVRDRAPLAVRPTVSRGVLVPEFAASTQTPANFTAALAPEQARYGGFNLLVGDVGAGELWWASNRTERPNEAVTPGIHTLSNAELDTRWPKTVGGSAEFERVMSADDGGRGWIEAYLDVLADRRMAPWRALPPAPVSPLLGKPLSARFVRLGIYGTRASTVLRIRHDGGFDVTERRFNRLGQKIGQTSEAGQIVGAELG
ncbi:NRDE family protein [Nocardia sp. NBC_01499]|uniref:NRDE family protein n=1 Tax=Nocardia sp. NBC_01499 TaxID=2903597 RepID=UPI0038708549